MHRYLLSLLSVLVCNTALYAVDLTAKVTDTNDKPLAGVRIDILKVVPQARVSDVLFDTSYRLYQSPRHPHCQKVAVTDKDGEFVIPGVDPDLFYSLAASVADKQVYITGLAPNNKQPITIKMEDYPEVDEDHWLKGKVIDRNENPVPHAFVESEYFQDSKDRLSTGLVEHGYAVTDEMGLFQIPIEHAPKRISLKVAADGYSEVKVYSENPSDPLPPIKIPKGTRLKGKLVADGKPAVNQKVAVVQVDQSTGTAIGVVENTHFFHGPHTEFTRYTNPNFISAVTATTDSEGMFYFETLPEDQHYAIYTPYESTGSGQVIRTAFFKAQGDEQIFDLGAIPLVRTVTLAGKVTMPPGEALAPGTLLLKHSPAFNLIEIPFDAKGEFRVENLSPETYQISTQYFDIRFDETRSAQHQFSNQKIAIHASENKLDLEICLRMLRKEELAELERNPDSAQSPPPTKPGEEDKFEQSLTGVVVDPKGKPLASISVTAVPLDPRNAFRRFILPMDSEFSTHTCPEGRFELNALSDQQMNLEVKSSAAARARFGDSKTPMFPDTMSKHRVQTNQRDIRILFDPEVFTKIPEIK